MGLGKVTEDLIPQLNGYANSQDCSERNQRSRDSASLLIRYSSVPRPGERLSSKPKLQRLLKYVQAERAGEKLSFSAASFATSLSPWGATNKDRICSLSSLYLFILLSQSLFQRYHKIVNAVGKIGMI